MKIFHTETQADYDALMNGLEVKGIETLAKEYWENNRHETVVFVHAIGPYGDSSRTDTTYGSLGWALKNHPSVPITKYKAKAAATVKFTKENVEAVINNYFETFIGACPDRLIADIYGMYESDTVTEQRYTVVIADRYLVRLFIGRTDYRFVEFDELWAWEPDAFQLTEAEIKAIDERYWIFAKPIEEEKE